MLHSITSLRIQSKKITYFREEAGEGFKAYVSKKKCLVGFCFVVVFFSQEKIKVTEKPQKGQIFNVKTHAVLSSDLHLSNLINPK